MKYELLPEHVISIFGYPDLLEKSIVDEAVAELVADSPRLKNNVSTVRVRERRHTKSTHSNS